MLVRLPLSSDRYMKMPCRRVAAMADADIRPGAFYVNGDAQVYAGLSLYNPRPSGDRCRYLSHDSEERFIRKDPPCVLSQPPLLIHADA